MKHILFVYNPVAGTGKVKKNLFEIVDFYNSNECLVTMCPIWKLNEFYAISGIEDSRYDTIVCSGGDGTLNIMLSFLKQHSVRTNVAYIPSGSTNDYAHSLGISEDFSVALSRTLNGKLRNIDLGLFNDKYFVYVAAFGLFTKVAYSTSQKAKNALGHTAYILEGIRQLSELKAYHMKVETEQGIIEDDFILGLVTNSLSIGGFKSIMPQDVALDDGKFEIMLIKMPTSIQELHTIVTSLVGDKEEDNNCIIYCKTQRVKISSEEDVAWTLDGEYGGIQKNVDIYNLQKEVSIIV